MNTAPDFSTTLRAQRLVAILRGLAPAEAVSVGRALVEAGIGIIEVPLNSPDPLLSIRLLRDAFPQAWVGAGTVLKASDVDAVHGAGGQLVVAPNFAPAVVRRARELGLESLPGVATPSEAFAALDAGATGLKLFPGEMIPAAAVKALRAVLPRDALLVPVGGVDAHNAAAYLQAGANALGIGSGLYTPGLASAEVAARARALVATVGATMRA